MKSKTFRLIDPFHSWGNHDYDWVNRSIKEATNRYDSGLCNRLFTWEIAYRLIKTSKDKRKILVQKRIFPELELIKLPNTKAIDYINKDNNLYYKSDVEKLMHLTVFDTKENKVSLSSELKTPNLSNNLNSNHVYNNWGFFQDGIHDYISKIKIKDKQINERLSNHLSFVGIQMRRGNGVSIQQKDVETFPKELRDSYLNHRKKDLNHEPVINFISNKDYINLISKILEINPQQRFFISNDLSDEFLDFLYTEFGTYHIISKKNYREEFTKYYENKGIDISSLQNYCNGLDNIIDLFGLSYTSFTIPTQSSTWGEFAQNYIGPKKYRNIPSFKGNNIDEIINQYQSFFKEHRDRVIDKANILNKINRSVI
jgi:hypothetical protein